MINKKLVKQNFSKGSSTYDQYAIIQRKMAEKLEEYFKKTDEELNILEIGSGTGIFTKYSLEKYKKSNFTLIDLSENMINISKEKFKNYNNIEYIIGDAEEIIFNNKFDIIISNASFQWFNNLENSLNKLKEILNKNGKIIFSIFGKETYTELKETYKKIDINFNFSQKFYSLLELKEILIKLNFDNIKLEEEIYIENYNSVLDFFKMIKGIGSNSALENKSIITPKIIKKINDLYIKNYTENNKIKVTNHLMYCTCQNV